MPKLLAIDDRTDNLVALSALINNLMPDCLVITAQSGKEGIDKAKVEQPDVILLDVKMPGMDGFEACRRLMSDHDTGHIPLIMITSIRTDLKSRIQGLEIGANAYLAKPIDEHELVSQVNVALRIKKAEDALRRERDSLERRVEERTSELQKKQIQLHCITDSARDAILMMDPHGNISFWNPAAETIFGYARDEVMGHNLHKLLAPEQYRGAYDKSLKIFQRTGSGVAVDRTTELIARRKDGTEIHVAVSLSSIEIQGEWHAVGIVRDITECKQAEQNLLQAKEQAEFANRAKSVFLANMSHEIRTPLNGILGMMQLMQMTDLDHDQKKFVELSITSVKRLTGLLSDILDLSRIEAGRMEMRQEEFGVKELCDSVHELLVITARKKGVDLTCLIDPLIPSRLVGDETRVLQILFNLVGNALKFTEEGSVRLELSRISNEKENEVLMHVAVSDTGIGISEDQLKRLFKPFVQVDGSYTRKYQGAGLGLYIVKRLVELLDGSIVIESEPGKGTSVHVVLPFKIPEMAVYAQAVMEASSSQKLQRLLKPSASIEIFKRDCCKNSLSS